MELNGLRLLHGLECHTAQLAVQMLLTLWFTSRHISQRHGDQADSNTSVPVSVSAECTVLAVAADDAGITVVSGMLHLRQLDACCLPSISLMCQVLPARITT